MIVDPGPDPDDGFEPGGPWRTDEIVIGVVVVLTFIGLLVMCLALAGR